MSEEIVTILAFSDNKDRRYVIASGIGLRAFKDTPRTEWAEAAAGFDVRDVFDQQDFAMLILDAEARKEGGMLIAQDLRKARDGVPPIVFLTARAQDERLTMWAGTAAIVAGPIDPIIFQETVANVLRGAK